MKGAPGLVLVLVLVLVLGRGLGLGLGLGGAGQRDDAAIPSAMTITSTSTR
jgi:hypothetical protein